MTKRRPAQIFLWLLFLAGPLYAQTEPQKIEGAKKEGSVYWYGSMNVDDASALIAGINKKISLHRCQTVSRRQRSYPQ